MTQKSITVDLGDRSYPIHIGAGVLSAEALQLHVRGKQVAVVTNQVVEPLWLSTLEQALVSSNAIVDVYVLPDGEAEKNLDNYAAILDFLVAHKHNRSTTVIALGGGVVGDMAGFAAATYQRGVDFIQVPTTLLAQVDSSVGGKTAVNLPQGKNLVGAFYQPRAVFADSRFLETLPPRELRAGLAEVLKYGIIRDRAFLEWLVANRHQLLSCDLETLVHAVARSCELKAEVVSADEREGGLRAILNFGHTFGHAIEALTGYTRFLHGEAVAIGMVMAADVSWRHGLIEQADAKLVRDAVKMLGLPDQPPALASEDMISAMSMDKKVLDGRLRLVVCRSIGDAFVSDEVAASTLSATLNAGAALCER